MKKKVVKKPVAKKKVAPKKSAPKKVKEEIISNDKMVGKPYGVHKFKIVKIWDEKDMYGGDMVGVQLSDGTSEVVKQEVFEARLKS